MSTFVLVLLIAAAVGFQRQLDLRHIRQQVARQRWSEPRVRWTPLSLLAGRMERNYWLDYRDERGQPARRLCRVTGLLNGPEGVLLEANVLGAAAPSHAARRRSRLELVLIGAGAGAFLGSALGIGLSLLIFRGSNIAPAYGLILGAPLGLLIGASCGALRAR
jgi:hypothetical protein